MVNWVDTTVVTVVIIAGLFLFYKVLKEPFDLFFSLIGRIIMSIFGKASEYGSRGGEVIGRTITYD